MKKLILESWAKTTLSFKNKIDKHVNGVSMRSPLGPMLANIIMTELKKIVFKVLFYKSIVKVYMWSIDNTLVLVKQKDIKFIHGSLNSFDKNIKFNNRQFYRWLWPFSWHSDWQKLYKHLLQTITYKTVETWPIKSARIKTLFQRAKEVCNTNSAFSKLKTSRNLCPGIHTPNSYLTP